MENIAVQKSHNQSLMRYINSSSLPLRLSSMNCDSVYFISATSNTPLLPFKAQNRHRSQFDTTHNSGACINIYGSCRLPPKRVQSTNTVLFFWITIWRSSSCWPLTRQRAQPAAGPAQAEGLQPHSTHVLLDLLWSATSRFLHGYSFRLLFLNQHP